MSAHWTDKYAIMRDLSLAQGSVPVDVEGILAAGDKPPAHNVVEETEEEFYRCYGSGDAAVAAPDVNLISQMLDAVRDIDVSSDTEEISQKPLKTKQESSECISLPFSFKKKASIKEVTNTSSVLKMKCKERIGSYVPSAEAGEYYKKFLERSAISAYVNEDIWTRTARQMKEIDERIKRERKLLSQQPPSEALTQQPPSEANNRDENQS